METNRGSEGILSEEMSEKRETIVELLKTAYFMELETVMNYVTNSINPDGVRAQEFAARIKELYGVVPGSMDFKASQDTLQPPKDQVDVVHVIKGVIDAEDGAIRHYTRIVEETEEVDPVTQDMVIDILHDEQGHRRLFEGFLREYEAEGLA